MKNKDIINVLFGKSKLDDKQVINEVKIIKYMLKNYNFDYIDTDSIIKIRENID